MRKLLLSAALLATGLPVAASAVNPVQVTREGYRLEYVVTPQADGAQLITGRDLTSNAPFSLRVAGQTVNGDVDGQQVSFRLPKKMAAALISGN